eukprot:366335-Chlamydomonas_euryale.AAC.9
MLGRKPASGLLESIPQPGSGLLESTLHQGSAIVTYNCQHAPSWQSLMTGAFARAHLRTICAHGACIAFARGARFPVGAREGRWACRLAKPSKHAGPELQDVANY